MANSLNKITTKSILDATVATADIADDAVTNAKIADNAIEGNQIAAGEVSAAKLASNSVTGAKIANDAVGAEHIEDLDATVKWIDNAAAYWGTGNDLYIKHDGTNNYIDAQSGHLYIQCGGTNDDSNVYITARDGENSIVCHDDGSVELYYDNEKVFSTTHAGSLVENTNGDGELTIRGSEGYGALLYLHADDGDDNADKWRLDGSSDGSFGIQNYASGSWETSIKCNGNGNVELYHDNAKKLETSSSGITVTGSINASGLSKASGNMYINNNDTSNGIITFATNTNERWQIDFSGNFIPVVNNSVNIGSSSNRVANLYTNDLHLSNEGHSNDIDSTWGNWTIQEGESDLFLKNNRSGKKYKFNLTEVN